MWEVQCLFSTEHFFGNFQGVGIKKIAVWFEWSFSTELVLAIFREWVSTKNSSVVPVVVFYGTLLLAIFKDWVSKKNYQCGSSVHVLRNTVLAIFKEATHPRQLRLHRWRVFKRTTKNRVRNDTRTQGLAGLVHEVTPIVMFSPG